MLSLLYNVINERKIHRSLSRSDHQPLHSSLGLQVKIGLRSTLFASGKES